MILEWNILHRVDSLICTPKKQQSSSITFKSHNGYWSQQFRPGEQIRRISWVRQVYFTKSCQHLGVGKSTFYAFYTSHLRWNSTMRRCIYTPRPRTGCSISQFFKTNCTQPIFSQYSGRSIVGFYRNRSKNFQNHLYGKQVLTFDKRQICSASRVECLSKH